MIAHTKYLAVIVLIFFTAACNSDTPEPGSPVDSEIEVSSSEVATPADADPGMDVPQSDDGPVYAHQAEANLIKIFEPWSGDLPDMLERRVIRALVPWSDTYYYLDGAEQRGIAFDALTAFEKWLNKELESGTVRPHVVILPVRRDELLTFISKGRGDIALGGITITGERSEIVDFSDPTSRPFSEVLVEAPSALRLSGIDDLSGRKVHIRESSSYWDSLENLNQDFQQRGMEPVQLVPADEYLSTEDLMQMANADAIDYTVADGEIAAFWANALPDVRVREDIAVRKGAQTAWAIRKNSPELKALLNQFVAENRQGTLMGNMIINRYLKDLSRLGNIHGAEEQKRLTEVIHYFEEYAPKHDFDTLMIVAQGFQESRLDQSRKSHRGAVGVMQLLPSTAAEPAVGIEDISTAENNIMAGIRYMAWIKDTYFDDAELDGFNKTAMAFASYNAGPNRIRGLRKKAEARGLDPNIWFDNVELIAAEQIGRETVDYVANIFKYYFAFKLSRELHQGEQDAK